MDLFFILLLLFESLFYLLLIHSSLNRNGVSKRRRPFYFLFTDFMPLHGVQRLLNLVHFSVLVQLLSLILEDFSILLLLFVNIVQQLPLVLSAQNSQQL